MPLPEALMVPPNDTMWAPETTVRPVARLLFTLRTVLPSFRNALPEVATCTPTAFPVMEAVARRRSAHAVCVDAENPVQRGGKRTRDGGRRAGPVQTVNAVVRSGDIVRTALDDVWSEIPKPRLS